MLFDFSRQLTYRCTNLAYASKIRAPLAVDGRTRATQRLYSSKIQEDVVFSGIQPTGVPHLGNYLGALQQWVRMQNQVPGSTQLLYSIVDLHAITTSQNADQLRRWKQETLATLLAIGVDPNRSTIFYQSAVWTLHYTCVSIDGQTS